MKTEFKNIPDDKRFANLRAKLSNSLADLRYYRTRIERVPGNTEFRSTALHLIGIWEDKINLATPFEANDLFYECWQFVHDFDAHLKNIETWK